jgi:hypothetical protein
MEDENEVISQEDNEQEEEFESEESETLDTDNNESEGEEDSGEVVVTIGEDAPTSEEQEVESAPAWVKNLRKENRELARENREYKKRLSAPAEQVVKQALPPKPTLASVDYDEDAYDIARDNWEKAKRQFDAQEEKARAEQKAQQEEWQASQAQYLRARAELKVKDFDDAEEMAKSVLTEIQQSILLEATKNSALVVYAIGKSPEKAKQLASIKNPIKFAVAIAELEKELKVTTRKAPPPPEKAVRGNMPVLSTDSKLAALEKEADKSGDRSKVIAYKRQIKAKNA